MAAVRKRNRESIYAALGEYLSNLPHSTREIVLTFIEVEEILGRELPATARNHRQWWENQESSPQAGQWQRAGFKTSPVEMDDETVRFYRDGSIAPRTRPRAMSLQQVVTALNEHALAHPIGGLPEWRKQHKRKERLPRTIFYAKVPDADKDRDYVFHVGGLSELQFNVGFELVDDIRTFRYGIAFSLQPTRELPEDKVVALLAPKIERFNKFFRVYPETFEGFEMWRWDSGRKPNHPVATIPTEDIHLGNFIFIGKLQPADAIDLDAALDDLDQLLPVYEYVEGEESFPAGTAERERQGSRAKSRAAKTSYIRTAKTIEVDLHHNKIGDALAVYLEAIHGEGSTKKEYPTGNGTSIDVYVRGGNERVYYEIKTAGSAQACIREALGQLLEYSCWPGATRANRLVVVGEAGFDKKAKAYIECLRRDFVLPIEYQQFDMKSKQLKTS
ncbi:MAG: hypothetical protein WDO72_12030 [Pseudomonadota bacterium]